MTDVLVRPGDAFLLGYLPHLVRAHFAKLTLFDAVRPGAGAALAALVTDELDALRRRGAEVVSCVWQVEDILGNRLHVEPPPPPRTAEEQAVWIEAATLPLVTRFPDPEVAVRAAFDLGGRVGAIEADLDVARKIAALHAVEPTSTFIAARRAELADGLAAMAAEVEEGTGAVDSATVRGELSPLAAEVRGAAETANRMSDDAGAEKLSGHHRAAALAARGLEAAMWGTPRDAVRDWQAKKLSGIELKIRLAEHRRWSVPVRLLDEGRTEPRVFVFDKRVLLAFSDADAVRARPKFLHAAGPNDNLLLTIPGWTMFSWLPDPSVDLIVLDASDDSDDPRTINFPAEMHKSLEETARDTKADLAATDWSAVDVETLRAHRYWILLEGQTVKNLVTKDGYGRTRVGIYTSEASLDAHLERATAEQRAEYQKIQRVVLPGEALFPSLLQLGVDGLVVNPYGPGKMRAFNRNMMEILANPGSSAL